MNELRIGSVFVKLSSLTVCKAASYGNNQVSSSDCVVGCLLAVHTGKAKILLVALRYGADTHEGSDYRKIVFLYKSKEFL